MDKWRTKEESIAYESHVIKKYEKSSNDLSDVASVYPKSTQRADFA